MLASPAFAPPLPPALAASLVATLPPAPALAPLLPAPAPPPPIPPLSPVCRSPDDPHALATSIAAVAANRKKRAHVTGSFPPGFAALRRGGRNSVDADCALHAA